ncbi:MULTISPECIES: hypothetical protein [Arthrobacter]|uniref:Uncharacterized protein n=1 Tax=Arthrobacter terricola TaxID=2547396 RepID=A0A4R5K587_9MICC|nr:MULTISPECIES: hypothetical protein [Arthrobacter]MBT8159318.1 hypothetical protein [Arthrobacter sp. GN70]TDF86874.1 hypothetical protein E1809_25475 [Arthrobacter terricola]
MSATDKLRDWAAAWGLGGAVNALEQIELANGHEVPEAVHDAGLAISEALEALHLDTTDDIALVADVWRAEP